VSVHWDAFENWHLVLPPNRPTERFIAITEAHLRTLPVGARVAVLGSTPELRDLLSRMGDYAVVVFEKSRRFHDVSNRFRLLNGPETLVIGDWLETLPDFRGVFHAVLSDLTSGNIDYAKRERFHSLVRDALVEGGLFIDRVLRGDAPFCEMAALDHDYLRRPFNLKTLNDFSSQYLFSSELLEDGEVVDSGAFYRILREANRPLPLRRLAEHCELITPSNHVWYYGRPWPKLRDAYHYGYRLVAQEDEDDSSVFFGRVFTYVQQRM
jgi:hypothetical protein